MAGAALIALAALSWAGLPVAGCVAVDRGVGADQHPARWPACCAPMSTSVRRRLSGDARLSVLLVLPLAAAVGGMAGHAGHRRRGIGQRRVMLLALRSGRGQR